MLKFQLTTWWRVEIIFINITKVTGDCSIFRCLWTPTTVELDPFWILFLRHRSSLAVCRHRHRSYSGRNSFLLREAKQTMQRSACMFLIEQSKYAACHQMSHFSIKSWWTFLHYRPNCLPSEHISSEKNSRHILRLQSDITSLSNEFLCRYTTTTFYFDWAE